MPAPSRRKAVSTRLNWSANSRLSRCRAPSKRWSRRARDLVGDRLEQLAAASTGSSAPATTSTGIARAPSRPRRSWSAERLAARGVALRRGGEQHRLEPLAQAGRGVGRDPALEHGGGDRRHAVGAHGRRALVPRLGLAELHRRAAQRHPLEPLGRLQRRVHGHGAAEREPDQARALDAEIVEQREQVAGQLVDRVRAGRDRRAAVAAVVVAQDAVLAGQRRRLRVPHLVRGAERAREHDDRRIVRALDAVVDARGHGASSPAAASARSIRASTAVWSSSPERPSRFCAMRSGGR